MKKIIAFILILPILFCSCSNIDESKNDNNSESNTLTTVTTTKNVSETTSKTSEMKTETEKTTKTTTTTSVDIPSSTSTKPTVTTASRPTTTTTTIITTTKPTTTTKQPTTTTTSQTTSKEVKLDVTPVKSKYYSTASAFACVEMIADYFGYTAKQDDVIKYLDIDNDIYKKNGRTYIGSPNFHFIGDPSKKSAIGSKGIPIEHAILEYFRANNINLEVLVLSKVPFFRLQSITAKENFLILWIADDVDKCTRYYIKDDINDVVAILPDNMTCMLVVAASDDIVTLYDPITNKTIKMTEEEYDKRACIYTINIWKN